MAEFLDHIEALIVKEGGYRLTDTPGDRGGQTYAGISRRSNPHWPGWAVIDAGGEPERTVVHALYKTDYWDPLQLDEIDSGDLAEMLLSSSVLSGPGRAAILGQSAAGVEVDGRFGPVTVAAVNGMAWSLFEARFTLARIARFAGIADRDPSQRKFFRGWVNRVLREVA